MKIYIVLVDITYDFDNTIFVETFTERKNAKKYMLETFKKHIEDIDFDTVDIEDYKCSAYDYGFFAENHCEIKIIEKEM